VDGSRRNRIAGYCLESFVSGREREAGPWEADNELSGSMNCEDYLDQLSNCWFLSSDSV
jgi:hypothetical protein